MCGTFLIRLLPHLIIVDNSSDRLVCWLSMLLSGIPNRWVRFLADRIMIQFPELLRIASKEINRNTIILQIRSFRALPRAVIQV